MKNYSLFIQLILAFVLVIMLILSIFFNNIFRFCEILSGLLLWVMALNNHYFYKRKYLTVLYIIFGIIVFIGGFTFG